MSLLRYVCPLCLHPVNQIEIHPFLSWDKCLEFCQRENIVVMAYSPLAQAGKLGHPTLAQVAKK